MSRMHNPPHPGKRVKEVLIDNTGLSVTAAAEHLGVTRVALSKLINGHSKLSPEMALRLSIALKTSPDMWLDVQKQYDLWQLQKSMRRFSKQVQVLVI